MQWIKLIVFCVGAFILSVHCDEIDDQVKKIIQSSTEMLRMYDEDLDKAVPIKELRASLSALEIMANHYHGPSQKAIDAGTTLGYKATDNYRSATNRIYSWCNTAKVVIDFLVDNKPNRTNGFRAIHRLTEKGVVAIKESLELLEKAQHQLTDMADQLRPVPSNLTYELAELRHEHEQRLEKLKHWTIIAALEVFAAVATSVLSFALGPVGTAIGLTATELIAKGIPQNVLDGTAKASENERWTITETYYKSLIKTVNDTMNTILTVKKNLDTELTYVTGLSGRVKGELEIMDDIGELPLKELEKMRASVKAYMDRHDGGSQTFHRRKRTVHHFTSEDLDVDGISDRMEALLKATQKQRDDAFWKLPLHPRADKFLKDISAFDLMRDVSKIGAF